MIEAMMLFGSAARGDINRESDVDLLFVGENFEPSSRKERAVEIQFISTQYLFEMADQGDLFAIHLAYEGKEIFDSKHIFKDFKERLKVRSTYSEVRAAASDLAWFLHDYGSTYEAALVNKRIAWCVRTIVISELVERGRFIFAPDALSAEYPKNSVPQLINLRRSKSKSRKRTVMLSDFIEAHCAKRPNKDSAEDFMEYFEKSGNAVAVSTVKKLSSIRSKTSVRSRTAIYSE